MIETIEISKLFYFNLLKDSEVLRRLKVGGVDNWEYYGDSIHGNDYHEIQDLDEWEDETKSRIWSEDNE